MKNFYETCENIFQAKQCSDALVEKVVVENRRTLDGLSAKCYFYHSRVYELCGQLSQLRGFLHVRLRTATLRHNEEAQVGGVSLTSRDVGVVFTRLNSLSLIVSLSLSVV